MRDTPDKTFISALNRPLKRKQELHPKTCSLCILLTAVLFAFSPAIAKADLITFELDNIFTDRGGQMTGQFTWTYTAGDFENGVGEFTSLNVPHTTHGLEDLNVTIESTQIEVSLDGRFHDDGVDVTLVLLNPFSPDGPAALDLDPMESKYSLGGNGFLDGDFISGTITPIDTLLPGDVTGDGFIDAADLDVLLANWGVNVGVDARSLGDLTGDGEVGQGDLNLVLTNWGNGTPPELSVPEPGTLAGLAVFLLCASRPRRR